MKRRVKQLFAIIKKAEKELEEIRKKCPHKKFHTGFYDYGPGCYINSTICDDCGYNLGSVEPEWFGVSVDDLK